MIQHWYSRDRQSEYLTLFENNIYIYIPVTCARDSKRIPGRTEFVNPHLTKITILALIWHDCGRPYSGYVADIMHCARAVRRLFDSNFQIAMLNSYH
jgi:hypothetical protein